MDVCSLISIQLKYKGIPICYNCYQQIVDVNATIKQGDLVLISKQMMYDVGLGQCVTYCNTYKENSNNNGDNVCYEGLYDKLGDKAWNNLNLFC